MLRVKYADYKKRIRLSAVKDSYDPETKTVELNTKKWDIDFVDYLKDSQRTFDQVVAEYGLPEDMTEEEARKEFSENQNEIRLFLVDEVGEDWEILLKYL